MLHHSNVPAETIDTHVHVFDPAFPYAKARHYTPAPAPLCAYQAQARAWGIGKAVLVQPSPYGEDNSALLQALKQLGPGRGRGVAVVDAATSHTQLEELKGHGVVGVRLNLEAGDQSDSQVLRAELSRLFEQVDQHGLLVELFVDAAVLEAVADLLADAPVPVLLDHFAGLKTARGLAQPGLDIIEDLLIRDKVWVKLSGPYRACATAAEEPVLSSIAARLLQANDRRLVWGSDWPHTGGGKDRAARPVTAIEPFRTHDTAGFLCQVSQWAQTENRYRQLLVTNPSALFRF